MTDKEGEKVIEIFNFWVEYCNRPESDKLTHNIAQCITDRLIDYSVADLKKAIVGFTVSAWHCGLGENCLIYDAELSFIFAKSNRVDSMLEKYNSPDKIYFDTQKLKFLKAVEKRDWWVENYGGAK